MYTYEKLGSTDIQTVHRAFVEAFSDYEVTFSISLEAFQIMLKRRGCDLESSIGAFKEPGHELVGFILNGIRTWERKLTAYDTATGITPANRNKGISNRMFRASMEVLERKNVEQYLLEVLQNNKIAYEIYKKQGFSVSRSYSVFELDGAGFLSGARAHSIEYVKEIKPEEWKQLQLFWDCSPSWQNSIDSVCAAPEVFVYAVAYLEKEIVGYGIVDKNTGDVPQIAVSKEHRQKGIGTNIAAALQRSTAANTLRVVNVDDACEEMKLFLHGLGFKQINSQYEMLYQLPGCV